MNDVKNNVKNDTKNDAKINTKNDIFSKILRNQIGKILKTISANYPNKFTRDNINLELEFLMNNIVLEDIDYTIFENKKKNKNKITNTENKKTNPFIADKDETRCCARVWGNIYNKTTNEEMNKIDKTFNVDNYKLLDINKFNELYNIGSRCRKKINDQSTKYCALHSMHLIHGDFFEAPNQELCHHFLKDNRFIT